MCYFSKSRERHTFTYKVRAELYLEESAHPIIAPKKYMLMLALTPDNDKY